MKKKSLTTRDVTRSLILLIINESEKIRSLKTYLIESLFSKIRLWLKILLWGATKSVILQETFLKFINFNDFSKKIK